MLVLPRSFERLLPPAVSAAAAARDCKQMHWNRQIILGLSGNIHCANRFLMGWLSPAGCVFQVPVGLWRADFFNAAGRFVAIVRNYSLESAGKGLDNEGLFRRSFGSFLLSSFSSLAYLLAALCDLCWVRRAAGERFSPRAPGILLGLYPAQELQQHFCKENLQHTVYLHLSCNRGIEFYWTVWFQ